MEGEYIRLCYPVRNFVFLVFCCYAQLPGILWKKYMFDKKTFVSSSIFPPYWSDNVQKNYMSYEFNKFTSHNVSKIFIRSI